MAVSLFWIGFPYLRDGLLPCLLDDARLRDAGRHRQQSLAPDRDSLAAEPISRAQGPGDVDSTAWAAMSATRSRRLSPARCSRVLSWRDVVHGQCVARHTAWRCFIMLYLGRKQSGDRDAGAAEGRALGDLRLRNGCASFGALLKNRALMTLAVGSAFRAMTQSALLTFLPLYLAARWAIRRYGSAPACSRCRPRASSRRRSPAICPTRSAAARSSSRACR